MIMSPAVNPPSSFFAGLGGGVVEVIDNDDDDNNEDVGVMVDIVVVIGVVGVVVAVVAVVVDIGFVVVVVAVAIAVVAVVAGVVVVGSVTCRNESTSDTTLASLVVAWETSRGDRTVGLAEVEEDVVVDASVPRPPFAGVVVVVSDDMCDDGSSSNSIAFVVVPCSDVARFAVSSVVRRTKRGPPFWIATSIGDFDRRDSLVVLVLIELDVVEAGALDIRKNAVVQRQSRSNRKSRRYQMLPRYVERDTFIISRRKNSKFKRSTYTSPTLVRVHMACGLADN